ncbi:MULTISPECIES: hypothetical protein [unclassified Caballeronia]|uniref:hypothetical protein n=1 Tax=unclassified Caballeronia TaxID=2646786 RepID=UPI00285A5D15|nr:MULTISPECIES: hypothetical protein [unclassified Caballeronia]MDR5750337.1 hypothetical protein [Caballeronia sp. LZ024]MDR5842631.1 hypothetical protein [Caballeronia sp. LZ031]
MTFLGKTGLPKTCKDLAIYIEDQAGLATDCVSLHDGIYRFTLKRTEANLAGWRSLLGSPFDGDYEQKYNVVVTVNDTTFPGGEAGVKMTLTRYSKGAVRVAAGVLALFMIGLLFIAVRTPACRDAGIPQMLWFERTYSLGRCQMALWVFVTSAAITLVWVITGDWDISKQTYILIGISATTGFGAIAIDATKGNDVDAITKKVDDMGLTSRAQVEALCKVVTGKPRRLKSVRLAFTLCLRNVITAARTKFARVDATKDRQADAPVGDQTTKIASGAGADAKQIEQPSPPQQGNPLGGPDKKEDPLHALDQSDGPGKKGGGNDSAHGDDDDDGAKDSARGADGGVGNATKGQAATVETPTRLTAPAVSLQPALDGMALAKILKTDGAKKEDRLDKSIFPDATAATYAELWHKYKDATDDLRTKGFFSDVITDASGPTIARFQAFAWTIGLALVYIQTAYRDLQAPTFPETLLTLMGISGGLYLGFKIPEKQPSTKST